MSIDLISGSGENFGDFNDFFSEVVEGSLNGRKVSETEINKQQPVHSLFREKTARMVSSCSARYTREYEDRTEKIEIEVKFGRDKEEKESEAPKESEKNEAEPAK